jgi:hypothetical protein
MGPTHVRGGEVLLFEFSHTLFVTLSLIPCGLSTEPAWEAIRS